MNMLYEGLKRSNATIVIVPSTAVEFMQLGGLPAMATVITTKNTTVSDTPTAFAMVRSSLIVIAYLDPLKMM